MNPGATVFTGRCKRYRWSVRCVFDGACNGAIAGRCKLLSLVGAGRSRRWVRSSGVEMKALSVLVAVVLATTIAIAQTPASPPTARPGEAEKGRKLFVSYGCYQCHGYEAQGSTATGPRLGPKPTPFAAFSRYVRQPSGQMPPYTVKVLSDAELAAIYAFVDARPAPKPVESIPLLK